MTTIAERKKIAEWVLNTKDEALLEQIKGIAFTKVKAINNYIEQYNKEIDQAIERVNNGMYKTQAEVEVFLNEWESK